MSPRYIVDRIAEPASLAWARAVLSLPFVLVASACGSNSTGSSATPFAPATGSGGSSIAGPTDLGAGGAAPGGATSTAAGATPPVGTGGTIAVGAGGVPLLAAGGTPSNASSGGTPSGGAPSGGAGQGGSAGPDPYRLSIAIPNVGPGEENTQCIQLRLSNAAPITVNKLHNTLSLGSHHFIVSALTAADAAEAPLTPCKPFKGALAGEPLSITQKKDDTVTTPDGVGYALSATQIVHLELHYINTSTDMLSVHSETEIFAADTAANLQESSVLLIGTLNISVPANSSASTGPRYIAMPSQVDGVNYFAMTGHTHRFGKSVKVSSAASATASPTVLYAPTPYDWDSPETVRFSPPALVPSGGGFVLQCDWQNPTSNALSFGESATQEMCFFWAYYYPKKSVSNLILEGFGPVDPAFFSLL